jgi:uncharacterized protein (UPF0332 family)
MRGIEFKKVSEEYNQSSEICKLRTAMSRAYYALYHHIKQTWIDADWNPCTVNDVQHDRLLRVLRRAHVYQGVADSFDKLVSFRRQADYMLEKREDNRIKEEELASESLIILDAGIEMFDDCDHIQGRKQINDYRKEVTKETMF